jgi:hypothetical protein
VQLTKNLHLVSERERERERDFKRARSSSDYKFVNYKNLKKTKQICLHY